MGWVWISFWNHSFRGPAQCLFQSLALVVMLRVHKTFILRHFEYCSPILLEVGRIQVKEDAKYCILRSLLGYCKSILYKELLQILNVEMLDQRKKQ